MFVYRPPKGSCWGHAIDKDSFKAAQKLDPFIDRYFERVESQSRGTLVLAWKSSVLPKIDWAEAFQGPEMQKFRQFLLMVTPGRVGFPMGIVFPLSTVEASSFEFLGGFSANTPFKMSAKHFQVGIVRQNGRFAWRKPDAEMAAKLEGVIV